MDLLDYRGHNHTYTMAITDICQKLNKLKADICIKLDVYILHQSKGCTILFSQKDKYTGHGHRMARNAILSTKL